MKRIGQRVSFRVRPKMEMNFHRKVDGKWRAASKISLPVMVFRLARSLPGWHLTGGACPLRTTVGSAREFGTEAGVLSRRSPPCPRAALPSARGMPATFCPPLRLPICPCRPGGHLPRSHIPRGRCSPSAVPRPLPNSITNDRTARPKNYVPESADHADQCQIRSRKWRIQATFVIGVLPITSRMLPITARRRGRLTR